MAPEQSRTFKSLGDVNDALQKCDGRKVRVEEDGKEWFNECLHGY